MKKISLAELSKNNGRKGRLCYIAYNGLVYDVTESYHWRDGDHWSMHKAGKDLTDEMDFAPHFEDVLSGFKIVGKLSKS